MQPTHRVTLTTDHRAYLARHHAGGWEIVLGWDEVDGCALLRWVPEGEVLLQRAVTPATVAGV